MAAAAFGDRSQQARDRMMQTWRQQISKLPLRQQMDWLARSDVKALLDLKAHRQCCRQVDGRRKQILAHACSAAWIRSIEAAGRSPLGSLTGHSESRLAAFEQTVAARGQDPRGVYLTRRVPNANSRLALSFATTTVISTAVGGETLEYFAGHRWTPEIAVRSEDHLDLMTPIEAIGYDHPPSPSAVAMQRGRFKGAREEETMMICPGGCGFSRRVTERQRFRLDAPPSCPDCGSALIEESLAMQADLDGDDTPE